MMNIKIIILMIGLSLIMNIGFGQNILTADQAVQMAVENNFDIKRSQNATEVAKNNASKSNTGQLPRLSLTGGANMNIDNSKITSQNGTETKFSWVNTQNANVSVTASYTIFNGYFRKYNINQLSKQYLLSE